MHLSATLYKICITVIYNYNAKGHKIWHKTVNKQYISKSSTDSIAKLQNLWTNAEKNSCSDVPSHNRPEWLLRQL